MQFHATVFSYILALLNSGEAKNIYLVGFDGYAKDDERSSEMIETIDLYNQYSDKEIISLTPTKYNIATNQYFHKFEVSCIIPARLNLPDFQGSH